MLKRGLAVVAAAASAMAACAIHPMPEDVTGVSTPHIVRQIRCETRDAAREMILRQLEKLARYDARAQGLLAQYTEDRESMSDFDPNRSFSAPHDLMVRNYFDLIYSAGVAYGFKLTMNEQNDLGATANLLGPWVNKLTLGLTGNANRSRENERTFAITDKFSHLLREVSMTQDPGTGRRYCDGYVALGPNYIYPIAGRIGVYKTVYDFFQLSIFEGLAPKDAGPRSFVTDAAPPVMADQLTFTTVVDLSVMPKVVFAPVGSSLQLADVSGTGLARRKDTHQVIVAVALEPKGPVLLSSLRDFVFSGEEISRSRLASGERRARILVGNRVTGSARSKAEAVALQKIEQLRSREFQLLPAPNQ